MVVDGEGRFKDDDDDDDDVDEKPKQRLNVLHSEIKERCNHQRARATNQPTSQLTWYEEDMMFESGASRVTTLGDFHRLCRGLCVWL